MPAISISNPVGATGNITITQGDDYYAADGRSLEWTWDITGSPELDLTGAAVELEVGEAITFTGSVAVTTDTQTVRVELTTAQTITIPIATATRFSLRATLPGTGGHVITLASGSLRCRRPAGFDAASA